MAQSISRACNDVCFKQGNGHPIAAVITTEAVAQSFYNTGIEYFNTYGGNPVSCAIASAVLDVLEDERLMDHAADLGRYIRAGFEDLAKRHEIIGDVRGVGMFVGVDLVKDRKTREPATKASWTLGCGLVSAERARISFCISGCARNS